MFWKITKYFYDYFKTYQRTRRIFALYRFLRRKLLRFLKKRPLVAVSLFFAGGLVIFFNPEFLPPPLKPPHDCNQILVDDDRILGENGHILALGEERKCYNQEIIAFEFFRWAALGVKGEKHTISGNIFIDGRVTYPNNQGSWLEYSLHSYEKFGEKAGNRFEWNFVENARESFLRGGCGYDETNLKADTEGLGGILIESSPRSDEDRLDKKTWEHCNYGSPGSPGFSECKWKKYQIFVPTESAWKWCKHRTLKQRWSRSGMRQVLLIEQERASRLQDAAIDGWYRDRGMIKDVPEETWRGLIGDAPALCWRNVDLEGNPFIPGRQAWTVFGRITKVYCDY